MYFKNPYLVSKSQTFDFTKCSFNQYQAISDFSNMLNYDANCLVNYKNVNNNFVYGCQKQIIVIKEYRTINPHLAYILISKA